MIVELEINNCEILKILNKDKFNTLASESHDARFLKIINFIEFFFIEETI